MVKISMFKRENDGALLVIWKTPKENLIGEVMRATFNVADGDATQHRVREYFGFLGAEAYWRRWA